MVRPVDQPFGFAHRKQVFGMKEVRIGSHIVGADRPCFIIAEIGGNFTTVAEACRLIDAVAEAGCDAVKLQTFRAETLTSRKAMFDMENTGIASQWEHFKKYELSREDHVAIFDHAKSKGLVVFSTPSHETDVDLLEGIGAVAHKIGSDDLLNLPLLRYAARTGKPVLLSTGMSLLSEVDIAVQAILETGHDQLVLFHCTTNYPTHPESVNLRAMQTMQKQFAFPVGYSDHTLGIDTCYAAAVLGAPVLEFHFTLDKNADGPDHMVSKDPRETSDLVRKVRQLPILLGDGFKQPAASEAVTRLNNRKGIVATANIRKGETLSLANIAIKRPGTGIGSVHFDELLGKAASRDIADDTPLTWDDIV
jgi:N-acetylneuraminate synthase